MNTWWKRLHEGRAFADPRDQPLRAQQPREHWDAETHGMRRERAFAVRIRRGIVRPMLSIPIPMPMPAPTPARAMVARPALETGEIGVSYPQGHRGVARPNLHFDTDGHRDSATA